MSELATGRNSFAIAVLSIVALTGCPAEKARDANDSTAPVLQLTVTAAKGHDGEFFVVDGAQTVELTGAGGSVLMQASDDDGVGWVEIWSTTTKDCGGTITGPGLAGAPTKRVEGVNTATSAQSPLTAGFDINLLNLTRGCSYTFDVWGKAANAATSEVVAQSARSELVLAVP